MKKYSLTGMTLLLLLFTACGGQAAPTEYTDVTNEYTGVGPAETESEPMDLMGAGDASLSVGEAFRAVLLSERPFFYLFNHVPYAEKNVMQENYEYLNEIIFNGEPMITPRFAIVDMDGDKVPEVVLEIDNYMGYVILRYKDGEIYGNEIGYRSLENLKENGTHGEDAGAGDNWIEKLYFVGDIIVKDAKAHQEENASHTSYTINDIPVNENVWNGIKTSFDETPEAEWHEFTEEAVEKWITENSLFTDVSMEAAARMSERQGYLDSLCYLVELTYDCSLKYQEDPDRYYADAESYYNGCMAEMDKIYRLCADQLDMIEARQQRWEEYMEQSMEEDMNAGSFYSITDPKEKEAAIYYYYGDMVLRRTLRLINYYYRFYFYDVKFSLHTFEQEEVVMVPEIQEYNYEDAVQIGEVQKLVGDLPGTGLGTWYTVTIDGVEFYYANYDSRPEEYTLFGWSIVSETYELVNGLKVGMKEEDVLELYPNMVTSVIDFEDNYIYYDESISFMGWNGTAYPRSDAGMDSDWDYEGKEHYSWTDQYDYIIVADIHLNDVDTLPIYLGLLIKDHVVAAITLYYPTAG